MLLKNLSYLFTAFDLSGEMNFFFLKYTNLFILCFILYYLYIKRANVLKLQYFWFIKLALFHQPLFFFFYFLNAKVTVVLLHYFWFVQYAMLHKITKY